MSTKKPVKPAPKKSPRPRTTAAPTSAPNQETREEETLLSLSSMLTLAFKEAFTPLVAIIDKNTALIERIANANSDLATAVTDVTGKFSQLETSVTEMRDGVARLLQALGVDNLVQALDEVRRLGQVEDDYDNEHQDLADVLGLIEELEPAGFDAADLSPRERLERILERQALEDAPADEEPEAEGDKEEGDAVKMAEESAAIAATAREEAEAEDEAIDEEGVESDEATADERP